MTASSGRKPNKYRETKKLILRSRKISDGKEFFREHKENDEGVVKTHIVKNSEVVCLYKEREFQKQIIVQGNFNPDSIYDVYDLKIGSIVNPWGYGFEDKKLKYFFGKYLQDINLVMLGDYEPTHEGNTLKLKIEDLKKLISELNIQKRANTDTLNAIINNFWKKYFPSLNIQFRETNNHKSLILKNLNDKLIDKMNAGDIKRVGDFYVKAAKKYKRRDSVRKMLLSLQKSSQLLSLQEIIKEFEQLIDNNPLESKWQKFFEDNIQLFDTRYVHQLNKNNIAVVGTQYPDLMLVDIYGYVDFYELKRSGMTLLCEDKSHNNYYWSNGMARSIAQATDYLQTIKQHAMAIEKGIKKETAIDGEKGLDVSIINPRALIVAGNSKDLQGAKMNDQFKSLRESMKDIEFLLYDELLKRLKNLHASIVKV